MLRFGLVGFLMACTLLPASATAQSEWKVFTSDRYHFSVRYPASWRIVNNSTAPLYIANFPASQHVEGVVIPGSGAIILVFVRSTGLSLGPNSLEALIKRETKFWKILRRSEIKRSNEKPRVCYRLVEVVMKSTVGLGTPRINTSYYCSVHGRLFVISLANWGGNSAQEQLQTIALKMALSLRILESPIGDQ